ncbi:MAG: glycosyltransferase [Azospirillaceae bacterium]
MRDRRVALVAGSPPDGAFCGVVDYTVCLARALTARGVEATVVGGTDWGAAALPGLRARIAALAPDIVHLQYPATAFGSGFAPHLLAALPLAGATRVVTLHEFSQGHALRKASSGAFSLAAGPFGPRALVFTTAGERAAYLARHPWARRRSRVVPVGSNIPFGPWSPARADGVPRIVHFGQIRPNKGLEAVIALARAAAAAGRPWRFEIVGSAPARFADYARARRAETEAAGLPIDWIEGADTETVARRLRAADAAYLPFPDGASWRRGSLVAALGNGCPVVSTRGDQTPEDLGAAVAFAEGETEALAALDRLIADADAAGRASRAATAAAAPCSWDAIAAAHRTLYDALPRRGRPAAATAPAGGAAPGG